MIDLSAIEWPPNRIYLPSVDSTNTYLKERLRAGDLPPREATLVVADRQTAGRGRGESRWHSDVESLTFSLAMRVADGPGGVLAQTQLSILPLIVAVAVTEAISAIIDAPVQIKWPNDVLIGGRKVCGVLIESLRGGEGTDVVVGVGINCGPVRLDASQLRYPATSVSEHLASPLPAGVSLRQHVLQSVCRQLADAVARPWPAETWVAIYERNSFLTGRLVSVDVGDDVYRGRCLGIDAEGGLVLRSDDRLHTIRAGQVTPLEP